MTRNISQILMLAVTTTWGCLPLSHAAEPPFDAQVIVDSHFPGDLREKAERRHELGGFPPTYYSSYELFDLDGTGEQEYIVAAYGNGVVGAVRVIRIADGSSQLVAAPPYLMPGVGTRVRSVDFDNDGSAEIVVSFGMINGSGSDWIFRWTGSNLELLGPATGEGELQSSYLIDALFIDLDGDRDLELIDSAPRSRRGEVTTSEIFDLVDGRFVSTGRPVYHFWTYLRGRGEPKPERRSFSVDDIERDYEMTLITAEKRERVDSATITLNGTRIVGPQTFQKRLKVMKVGPLQLFPENGIEVEVRGDEGSELIVIVQPVSEGNGS